MKRLDRPLLAAAKKGDAEKIRPLAALREKAGANLAAVQFIFSSIGSNMDVKSSDASLFAAILRGNSETVRLLLAHGARRGLEAAIATAKSSKNTAALALLRAVKMENQHTKE